MSCWSITFNNFKTCWNGAKSFAKVMPEIVLGTGTETIAEALKTTKGSIFAKSDAAWKAIKDADTPFFKNLFNNLKDLYPSLKTSIADSAKAANAAGKSSFIGGIKGLGKGIQSKLPLIGSLALILMELPNIFTATKEKGIFQGGAEVVKATAKLTGASIGAAIGTAVIPIPLVGSMIGWVAGEWLTGKIVGKSYSDQIAEKEEEMKQQQEQAIAGSQNNQQQNINPFWMQESQNVQNLQQPQQIPQVQTPVNPYMTQPVYNPQMQVNNPQFTGLYNPFNSPYAGTNNFMMPQMQFNNIA